MKDNQENIKEYGRAGKEILKIINSNRDSKKNEGNKNGNR